MDKSLTQLSKTISYALRHRPQEFGILLEPGGWIEVDVFLEAIRKQGKTVVIDDIKKVIDQSTKKRFEFSEDGKRIRATHGHSFPVDIQYEPQKPPDTLFHGTVEKFLPSIKKHGLVAGNRLYVHLSGNIDGAVEVASRRGRPIVLAIKAGGMHSQGMEFYCSASNIWLVEKVPPKYIDFSGNGL